MKPDDAPGSGIPKTDIFREQALQAWRGQEFKPRVLLNLSPGWMRWALAGIFLLAGLGLLLAAKTTIPIRATSVASPRLSSGGDSVYVEGVFALQSDAPVRRGETITFRSREPGSGSVDLVVVTVAPYGEGLAPARGPRRFLVVGAVPMNRLQGETRLITTPGSSGTVHILLGHESLLHLLRPRTPGGVRA